MMTRRFLNTCMIAMLRLISGCPVGDTNTNTNTDTSDNGGGNNGTMGGVGDTNTNTNTDTNDNGGGNNGTMVGTNVVTITYLHNDGVMISDGTQKILIDALIDEFSAPPEDAGPTAAWIQLDDTELARLNNAQSPYDAVGPTAA